MNDKKWGVWCKPVDPYNSHEGYWLHDQKIYPVIPLGPFASERGPFALESEAKARAEKAEGNAYAYWRFEARLIDKPPQSPDIPPTKRVRFEVAPRPGNADQFTMVFQNDSATVRMHLTRAELEDHVKRCMMLVFKEQA